MSELAQNMTSARKMASNTSASVRKEIRQIENLQGRASTSVGTAAAPSGSPTGDPFAALLARRGRPMRVAILSDFTRIPYANGAVFQTRFLYHALRKAGHDVTVIGPADPEAQDTELPPGTVELPSVPLKTYPGLYLPMPGARWIFDSSRWNFDLCFGQATTLVLEFGVWLRKMKGVPLLCVNTTHLSAAYDVLLPEGIAKIPGVHAGVERLLKRPCEKLFSRVYNDSDGLVVLSEGLREYWRERGVTVPIHVIPRTVQPEFFDRSLGADPYVSILGPTYRDGSRLLCAGRHTREKSQDRLIRIFARTIAPSDPTASLTLLGVGPDTEFYERVAREEGVSHRVFFPGEVPFTKMADYYAHADLFVHASLSETYGNVLGEALYCGTPTVAFADGMGVDAQMTDGINGLVLDAGPSAHGDADSDRAFGEAVLKLLESPEHRALLGKQAARRSRERCSPHAVKLAMVEAFDSAERHLASSGLRPAYKSSRATQWMTTQRHARSWAVVNGSMYLAGFLRPPPTQKRARVQPQF